ncbi:MAG: tRNA uridine-5-carboxymethylaminomethyl(34) synthesis enzyme MnmG [Culicoidibacterales bacterium]
MKERYDVIVVGGGHAGVEAAHAAAKIGVKTALITASISNIAAMPCNPSIGGPAKGIVVREVDALGGLMGQITDNTALQMKMLNLSKGPGVHSLRAQADRLAYPRKVQQYLLEMENLDVIEETVKDIIVDHAEIQGVLLENNQEIHSQKVIITTGTYMKSLILVGDSKEVSGPHGEKTTASLSEGLKSLGFELFRLKTGTPPRVHKDSIDYSKTEIQPGDRVKRKFSNQTRDEDLLDVDEQLPCYLTYTSPQTLDIIREHLQESAMYSGNVEGVGPRYCPSIEDKVVRFFDKERHQIFLEPESTELPDIYVQGFSTSMPHDVQDKMVRSIPGLEQAEILKYGYAIEYDAIDPMQLRATLETKKIKGLYTAGQVNGTSGYEEAAGQGIIAGMNAALATLGKEPIILKRNEAYIGVMIDDLVTKGTQEPYRLLTSRAEHRLLLRHDNADLRLFEFAYTSGMKNDEDKSQMENKRQSIEHLIAQLGEIRLTPKPHVQAFLKENNSSEIRDGLSAFELLKRPEIQIDRLLVFLEISVSEDIAQQASIAAKYAGYIQKAAALSENQIKLDAKKIPSYIRYDEIPNLALEAKQKLEQIRPETLGQASRISGVNPSDVAILSIWIKKSHQNS